MPPEERHAMQLPVWVEATMVVWMVGFVVTACVVGPISTGWGVKVLMTVFWPLTMLGMTLVFLTASGD
jgi:hypothetical protein